MSSSSITGPLCSPWITGADVASCGPDLGVGSDVAVLDDAAYDASYILFELAGRRFPGECTATVRPCRDKCQCWLVYGGLLVGPWPDLGYVWGYDSINGLWAWNGRDGQRCGCGSDEQILLAGYPVLAVTEVKINGDVVDPATYRLDERRKLVRLDDPGPPVLRRRWPACQNITLPDTAQGTWSVTYTWGGAPPQLGRMAAASLARELWKACSGDACALPTKVTKVVRQGTTYDRTTAFARALREGSSGLPIVDAFIATVNPSGRRRAPLVWSPDRRRFPRKTGS